MRPVGVFDSLVLTDLVHCESAKKLHKFDASGRVVSQGAASMDV